jgi:hypothetical protein
MLVLLAIVASVLAHAPAAGQQGRSDDDGVIVTGVVLDEVTRSPIRGALVTFTALDRKTFTDERGRFALKDVPAGAHEITVEQLGYTTATFTQSVSATSGSIELLLAPDPVELEAIEVINDRLAARRRTATTSVLAYDADDLRASGAWDAHEFVRQRVFTRPCPGFRFESTCVVRRGRVVVPRVYIDEFRTPGGMTFLAGLPTQDLYLVEIYDRGAHVRVYTNWFARDLAEGRRRLDPVILF